MRHLLFVLGLVLALPGVAREKPQIPAELAATNGYAYVAFPKGGGASVTVRQGADGKPVVIDAPALALHLPGAQAFGRWLPAGHYQVVAWNALEWKNGPEFDVQAGRITDLGDFVPVNIGGYQLVLLPVHAVENDGGALAAAQPFASLLKDSVPIVMQTPSVSPAVSLGTPSTGLGLIADMLIAHDRKINKPSTLERLKSAHDPVEFLRIERSVAPPLQDEPARLPDGTLYFTSDLGQLRKRQPDGQWSNVGMDTLRQILAVESDGGRLLAGSDDGHIRASQDAGATWTEARTLGSMESIIDIDHADNVWVVATTELFKDAKAARGGGLLAAAPGSASVRLRVYVGHRDDLADLAVAKEFTLTPKDQIGWLGARGQLVDGRYYITVAPSLQRLDVATGRWTTITPGPRISSSRVDPDTGVVAALWSQGLFSKVYVSSDLGDHWTQIGRPPYVIMDVQMDNADRGWASRWNMNAFSGTWETYAFVPATKDWIKSGEAPFNCKPLRVAKDIPVLCIATDASIFGLHDGKWDVEFSAQ